MPARTTLAALTLALAAVLSTPLPAAAATRPTIVAPKTTLGYGPIAITGTARPGASVHLLEAAYVFRGALAPAVEYDNGDIVEAVADSSGHYALRRTMDSGFVLAVRADGLDSATVVLEMVVRPTMRLTTAGSTVTVALSADPGQPGLPVAIQRQNGSAWTTVADGFTGTDGVYSTVLTAESAGTTQHYRAAVGPDPANAILLGHSATVTVVVGGAEPTAPPTSPQKGDVQFNRVRYDSPGADNGTNSSLNGEYFQLKNRTTAAVNLKGWSVRDRAGNVYAFLGTVTLDAGRTLVVHTGRGTDNSPAMHRYWGRTGHVWNNGGDSATLRSPAATTIDSCTWGAGKGYTNC